MMSESGDVTRSLLVLETHTWIFSFFLPWEKLLRMYTRFRQYGLSLICVSQAQGRLRRVLRQAVPSQVCSSIDRGVHKATRLKKAILAAVDGRYLTNTTL